MVRCCATALCIFRPGMADDRVVVCPGVSDICHLCSSWMDQKGGRGCIGVGETKVQSTKRMSSDSVLLFMI